MLIHGVKIFYAMRAELSMIINFLWLFFFKNNLTLQIEIYAKKKICQHKAYNSKMLPWTETDLQNNRSDIAQFLN